MLLSDAERTQRAAQIAAMWEEVRDDESIRSMAEMNRRMGFKSHSHIRTHAPDTFREILVVFKERRVYTVRLTAAERTQRAAEIAAMWNEICDDETIRSMAEVHRRLGFKGHSLIKNHAPAMHHQITSVLQARGSSLPGRGGGPLTDADRAQRALEINEGWDRMCDDESIRSVAEFSRRMGFKSQSWVKSHAPDTYREMRVLFKKRNAASRRGRAKAAAEARRNHHTRRKSTPRPPRAQGRQRIEFSALPDESPDPIVTLAPLHVTIDFHDGMHPLDLDWTAMPNTRLVRDFMAAILEVCGPDKQRTNRTDCGALARIALAFLAWIPQEIQGAGQLEPDLFAEWEACLREQSSDSVAYSAIQNLMFLLKQRPLLDRLTARGMRDRIDHVSSQRKPKSQPHDAYSKYVAAQIREKTKTAMAAVVERMTVEAPKLLAAGVDPRGLPPVVDGHGNLTLVPHYRDAANVLKVLEALGPITWAEFCAVKGSDSNSYVKHWKTSLNDDPEKGKTTFVGLLNMLYPGPSDLAPFLLRLALDTGIPPTYVEGLRLDCMSFAEYGRTTTITWDKTRTKRTQSRLYTDSGQVNRNDGTRVTIPGGLIRTVRQLTQRLRDTLPDDHADRDMLFLVRTHKGTRTINWTRSDALKRRATAALGVVGDDEEPIGMLSLVRLRKTASLEADTRHGGDAAHRMGHSELTHRAHYEAPPVAQSDLRSQVVAAQTGAVDLLRVTPSVVVDVDTTEIAPATSVDKNVSLPVLQNVFVANCKDFTNSPFAKPGVPCPKAVWNCLGCDRAMITSDHLPWVLCLLETMKRERQYLDEAAFHHKFGEAHDKLVLGILPRFPENVIQRSSVIANDINPSSFVPLEMRINQELANV